LVIAGVVFVQVALLASKGGNGVKDVIRRILGTLFTNQFMTCLNWTGQGDKVAFSKLLLLKIIRSTLHENFSCIVVTVVVTPGYRCRQ